MPKKTKVVEEKTYYVMQVQRPFKRGKIETRYVCGGSFRDPLTVKIPNNRAMCLGLVNLDNGFIDGVHDIQHLPKNWNPKLMKVTYKGTFELEEV